MRVLSTLELMSVWEQGLNKSLVQRALMLLSAASPEVSIESLAQLAIGQRDNLLLSLREQVFGSQLVSVANCPTCGERLELLLQVADIQVPLPVSTARPGRPRFSPNPPFSIHALFRRVLPRKSSGSGRQIRSLDQSEETFDLRMGSYQVQFRLPNSFDLLAIALSSDPLAGSRSLLGQCLVSVQKHGILQSTDQLPDELIEAVATRMVELDPQAEVLLSLDCPACKHQWRSPFDIVSFFWSEINAWAIRLLREVHVLAAAYGWREADILAMNSYRRQCYLEMLGNR